MRFFRGALPALTLTLAPSMLILSPAQAQDPLQELRQYDYQNRKAVDAIARQIVAAGADPTKLAPIETGLIALLQDPQATVGARQEACTFLRKIGTGRSVPVLTMLLRDPATANLARLALEQNADATAGAALRAALGSTSGATLIGVMGSLGARADGQAVPALTKLAGQPDAMVAEAAVRALGRIGTTGSVSALRSLKSPALQPTVQAAFLVAADRLSVTGKRSEATALYTTLTESTYPEPVRAGALTGLATLDAPGAGEKALTIARTAPEPGLQRVAARLLGLRRSPATLKTALAAFPKLPARWRWSSVRSGRATWMPR